MRKNTPILFSCFTIACLALWHAPSAQAQLIVYEGFDYPEAARFPAEDGSLDGGIGWEEGWITRDDIGAPSSGSNGGQQIAANGLFYTDSKGSRLQTVGRALDISNWCEEADEGCDLHDGQPEENIHRPERHFDLSPEGPAATTGLLNPSGSLGKLGTTLWMSVVLEGRDEEFEPGDPGHDGGVNHNHHVASFFEFEDANLGGASRSLYIGRPYGLQLDGTSIANGNNEAYGIARKKDGVVGIRPLLDPVAGSGVDAGLGAGNAEKVFMVLKLDFNGQFDEIAEAEFGLEAGDYGTNVSAWINPDLDADLEGDPNGLNSGNYFAQEMNFWEMSFTNIRPGGNADILFDEFRIGATYADVAPIDTSPGLDGDFDTDGDVDGADFLLWQRDTTVGSLADWETNFGAIAGVAATSAVPEPSTVVLACLTLAGFAGCGTRRIMM